MAGEVGEESSTWCLPWAGQRWLMAKCRVMASKVVGTKFVASNGVRVLHAPGDGPTPLTPPVLPHTSAGDIPSPLATACCRGPIQRRGPGAAEGDQPTRAAAGAAELPLLPAGTACPTSPTLRCLRLHCEGQLLLQWPRRPLCSRQRVSACQGSWCFPCGTYTNLVMLTFLTLFYPQILTSTI